MINIEKIKKDILRMVISDQLARKATPIDWERVNKIDETNTKNIKKIIHKIGWPTISKVGAEAAEGAWLLVQHADHDLKFQRDTLDLMTKQSKTDVDQKWIAMLTDRVMMKEQNIQKYGTQLIGRDGYLFVAPVVDFENLDKLRKKSGLKPIKEYLLDFDRPAFLTENELKDYLEKTLDK